MKELSFSVSNSLASLLKILKPYNQNRPVDKQVKINEVPWEHAKQELVAMALHGSGGDVSQVGGPLVDDLIAMRALRSFANREIDAMGGVSSFNRVAWENAHRAFEGQIFAIPWIIDPRAIFYWREPLEKAGIEGSVAFRSPEKMDETLQRLQTSGVRTPLSLPLDTGLASMQAACTWIWGAGGEIGNEKEISILHKKSIAGLKRYFNLSQYMPAIIQSRSLMGTNIDSFLRKETLVTLGHLAHYYSFPLEIRPQIGVALGPGPFFVGSSNLVIWQNTQDENDAVNLVQYLTSEAPQMDYCTTFGFLPAKASLLSEPPFSTDPALQVFTQSANNGRSWSGIRMGGLLEDLLSSALLRIWGKVLSKPQADLETAAIEEIEPIVRRINRWNE